MKKINFCKATTLIIKMIVVALQKLIFFMVFSPVISVL